MRPLFSTALAVVVLLGTLCCPGASQAGSKGGEHVVIGYRVVDDELALSYLYYKTLTDTQNYKGSQIGQGPYLTSGYGDWTGNPRSVVYQVTANKKAWDMVPKFVFTEEQAASPLSLQQLDALIEKEGLLPDKTVRISTIPGYNVLQLNIPFKLLNHNNGGLDIKVKPVLRGLPVDFTKFENLRGAELRRRTMEDRFRRLIDMTNSVIREVDEAHSEEVMRFFRGKVNNALYDATEAAEESMLAEGRSLADYELYRQARRAYAHFHNVLNRKSLDLLIKRLMRLPPPPRDLPRRFSQRIKVTDKIRRLGGEFALDIRMRKNRILDLRDWAASKGSRRYPLSAILLEMEIQQEELDIVKDHSKTLIAEAEEVLKEPQNRQRVRVPQARPAAGGPSTSNNGAQNPEEGSNANKDGVKDPAEGSDPEQDTGTPGSTTEELPSTQGEDTTTAKLPPTPAEGVDDTAGTSYNPSNRPSIMDTDSASIFSEGPPVPPIPGLRVPVIVGDIAHAAWASITGITNAQVNMMIAFQGAVFGYFLSVVGWDIVLGIQAGVEYLLNTMARSVPADKDPVRKGIVEDSGPCGNGTKLDMSTLECLDEFQETAVETLVKEMKPKVEEGLKRVVAEAKEKLTGDNVNATLVVDVDTDGQTPVFSVKKEVDDQDMMVFIDVDDKGNAITIRPNRNRRRRRNPKIRYAYGLIIT
ncbi:hypothetical protein XA68_17209 [Ophiocordyceps unilateralis]|uniref:Uncharacterized protein n=1 Tax=Ophiocordyceps unilateralis TaxID=268505 RepID=A0A2A9PJS7_OPHUN|nr:hypothetical protein XA68_17209 [Ophiocordyceps unilateralis]